jgi:hypothetical protein
VERNTILLWLLVYTVGLSGTIGAVCNLDMVACLKTGDTTQWTLQLIAVIVSLLAGDKK